jgi:aryl-alcohol dehydrogenase-like predicted oxidoreductase
VIAYSPIAQGLLSGRYQKAPPSNFRRVRSDFRPGTRARLAPLIEALTEIGGRHQATPAQVALAWLVNKPNVVAIPGASNLRQLEENVAAGDLMLEAGESSRLDGLAPLP